MENGRRISYWGVDDGGTDSQDQSSSYSTPWNDFGHSTGESWWVSDENQHNSELFKYSSPIKSSLPTYEESTRAKKIPLQSWKLSEEEFKNFDARGEGLLQDQFLESNYGLHRLKIIPDGNCLYRSISQALGHDQNCHMEIRLEIVSHMKKYWNRFDKLIEGDTDDYLEKASQENTWGGYLEILAVTELYDVNVIIVLGGSADNSEVSLTCHHFSGEKTPRETIWLSWLSKGHYDLIVDRKADNCEYKQWLSANTNETENDEKLARILASTNETENDEKLARMISAENEEFRPDSTTQLAKKTQYEKDYELAMSLQRQFDESDD